MSWNRLRHGWPQRAQRPRRLRPCSRTCVKLMRSMAPATTAHALLAEAAHNEFLAELLERMYNQVLRLWYVGLHRVGRLPEAIAEHHELVNAIAARDADGAEAVMRRHVAGFEKEFLKVV